MNAISLFSGCGGCSLGLRQAGFAIKLAADIDRDTCETYALNLGHDAIWHTDLASVQPEDLLARSGLDRSRVDLIVGGPPCQGFSSAGARDWSDARNALLRRFVTLVTAIKPTWFIMENVEGLLTANEGYYLIEAITRFLQAGYWVRAQKVYAEQFGLPQRRKRVFIVGNLEHYPFAFPPPLYHESPQFSLFAQRLQLSVLDAIDDLPSPRGVEGVTYEQPPGNDYQALLRRTDGRLVLHHEVRQVNEMARRRIQLLAEGATMKTLPSHLQHPSFMRRALRRVMDGTPTEKRGGAPAGLRRLVASRPALTITSAAPAEFVHPLEDRLLTLRECARIQSFPDWFEFRGSWGSIATQIGNAIPPLLMNALATQIASTATWRPVDGPQGRWLGIEATQSKGISPALMRTLRSLEERAHVYA